MSRLDRAVLLYTINRMLLYFSGLAFVGCLMMLQYTYMAIALIFAVLFKNVDRYVVEAVDKAGNSMKVNRNLYKTSLDLLKESGIEPTDHDIEVMIKYAAKSGKSFHVLARAIVDSFAFRTSSMQEFRIGVKIMNRYTLIIFHDGEITVGRDELTLYGTPQHNVRMFLAYVSIFDED